METLTRLVTESLARHGLDRPLDYRRLQWSHWFRCQSHHSLLVVPSKPGVFALAEEVLDSESIQVQVEPLASPARSAVEGTVARTLSNGKGSGSIPESRRMLAVGQFFEDDDMAFALDRMLSQENPMRARLASGRYFVRFAVIEDPFERRSVLRALNQWILPSAEKAIGMGPHFSSSLERTPEPPSLNRMQAAESANSISIQESGNDRRTSAPPRLNSAIATTIHYSSSFPSGF
jgi:hypothetical protein